MRLIAGVDPLEYTMIRIFLVLGLSVFTSAISQTVHIDTDAIVLKNTAEIMKLKPEQLKVELPFSKQIIPGDALDLVEIVMAVEDELGIEIDDDKLDAKVGANGVEDIAQKLTIKKFQEIVKSISLKKRPKQLIKERRGESHAL